ncbi:hypothetical protein JTE90_014564 [Oedothorax gibbosus]|uniref:Uncharacterized protein n=1 Tax=Oedothorax gibbosus TaxID=931172 RepID=A0AAV6UDK5_9ARAC|nr:hypothetical protein JTE90_014564 [Oedothorax gibbosus]
MAVWQIFALMCVLSCAIAVYAYPGYDNEVHGYEYKHPPQPYGFGYDIKDHHGNQQFRKEHSDGKRVVGSYGYTDAHGVHRLVDYVADEYGFRAKRQLRLDIRQAMEH